MSRMIFVPQFPTKMRYQEFWYTELKRKFEENFSEVIVLGKSYIENEKNTESDFSMFSPIQQAINLEMAQINEFLNLKIYDDDILFMSDISFPGFFGNVFHHKRCGKMYAFVHGTSKNYLDYFQDCSESKWLIERGHAKLFDKIFIGSRYHQKKLGWKNTEVVGVPIPPFETFNEEKKYDIISVARFNRQKVTKWIEEEIEKDFSKVVWEHHNTWEEYYKFLSSAKILLITSKEETFGYSCMEAIMNNTAVFAPNRFSYPELLPKIFLYDNIEDLKNKISLVLIGYLKPPQRLLCQDICEKFCNNIIYQMKGWLV